MKEMAMLKTITGIVLKTDEYGESDKILTVFSKEDGKLPVLYKRAKVLKKGGGAVSQLFSVSEYACFVGKNFYIHNQSMLLKSFAGLQKSLKKLAAASYLAQLLNFAYENYQKDERAYMLLLYCLNKIEKSTEKEVTAYIALFQMKLLALIGYSPMLNACVLCGSDSDLGSFDVEQGGIMCEQCSRTMQKYRHISEAERKILNLLLNIVLKQEDFTNIDSNHLLNLVELLHCCLTDKLEKQLSTYDFLIAVL
jgi:DNA repair protein RecO (recombination protein O)